MFSKELEEVIEAALADGTITDKERAVLHKRAAAEGVDPDELDVVIDGRLAKTKKQEDWLKPAPPSTLMSNKVGNVMKCPNCGAPYQSGTVKCPECGHVFQNRQAIKSSKQFSDGLHEIIQKWGLVISKASQEEQYDNKGSRITSKVEDAETSRDREILSYITNYPIPFAKDDLLDFIASMGSRKSSGETTEEKDAYRAKLYEAINKAKTLFPDDSQFAPLIKKYTKFSIDNLSASTKKGLKILLAIIGYLLLMFIIYLFSMLTQ